MSKLLVIFHITIIFFTVVLASQCNVKDDGNHNTKSANAGSSVARPADEAKIETNIPDYEIKETNLEYLQSLPIPDFQIVFELSNNQKISLSEDVKNVLNSHWREAIRFQYETEFNKITDGQMAVKKDMDWLRYCANTKQKLQKFSIEAPNGNRNISQTEASNLFSSLNKVAGNVIDKAKKPNSKFRENVRYKNIQNNSRNR